MTGARESLQEPEGAADRLGRDRRQGEIPATGRDGASRRARTTARRSRSPFPPRHAASVIRERLTQQTWTLILRLRTGLAETPGRPLSEAEIIDCVDDALTTIAALSGLFDENFNRGAGWRFYELGRRIERGINTCRIARQFAHQSATEHDLDVMLDLIESQITYHSRTLIGVALAPVRDLALARPLQPALRGVSDEADRRAYRDAAGTAAGRHPRGAAAAGDAAQRRTDRRNRRQAR